jgi:hypothetical protein
MMAFAEMKKRRNMKIELLSIGNNLNLLAFAFLIFGIASTCNADEVHHNLAANNIAIMEVYKSPTCQCCGRWVEHVKLSGIEVSTQDTNNLSSIKTRYEIAPEYQSCHTGVIDGYVFEGHIPASIIKKFLTEKPDNAIGLSVPGMPIGSPGMEMGARHDDYDVLLLKSNGQSEVYVHISQSLKNEKLSVGK